MDMTDFKTISSRKVSFAISCSSVQSSQNVTTESAAPDKIVFSSVLTARAQTCRHECEYILRMEELTYLVFMIIHGRGTFLFSNIPQFH